MLGWVEEELAQLRMRGLLREQTEASLGAGPWIVRGGRRLLNLCANDYLSLGATEVTGAAGAGASRLVVGDMVEHTELERALAEWLHVDATLLFASGYAANVGTVAALASGPDTVIVSDALNHASLVDGCRLARARVVVTPHRDVGAVRDALAAAPERRRLVLTDSYFSMDGTLAPIAELAAECERHGAALYVDEAHALGVYGPEGRGVCAAAGVVPDVLVGTFGKSFGVSGAFVAGSASLGRWLWNRARSFVFSTGISPVVAVAALQALPRVRQGDLTRRLWANVELLRGSVARETFGPSEGPIAPVVVGDAARAVAAARRLLESGLFVQPIRPPTVPRGSSRLRVTVQAGHDPDALVQAARALVEVARD